MSLPYENSTSGANALEEIGKILTRFGCARFGHMTDNENGHLLVQFTHRGNDVSVKASYRGYAAAWLKEHPHSNRMKANRTQHEKNALEQAKVSVCSILRDWVKSQVTMIEIGVLSFEGAFLGQLMLANGKSVLDHAAAVGLVQIEGGAV
ncbi:hypothetical protein GJ698_02455 [Pseudoduganella sp. FT26W]|uniref:Uncharacterized protein n=1 Tax=Duganella aquatilis TaxID=2666082 RepID=A0A844CVZ8_9BURK|nr:hypothetical protein [Duganella aquatilis]MRW82951.1 hypothetical protein [Duganella aquatilis]